MTRTRWLSRMAWTGTLALCWMLASATSANDAAQPDPAALLGFTQPLRSVTLAPLESGRIATIAVHEGEVVSAGALLFSLDDAVQQRRVAIAKANAESTFGIDLARVRLGYAERELQRVQGLAQGSAVSAKELADAESELDAAKLGLASAEFEHAQAVRECALEQVLLDRMHIHAPFDAYIAKELRAEGDTVEDLEGVLELVQLDPLSVTFDCPIEYAAALRVGQPAAIVPLDELSAPRVGKVVFLGRVADAASQTFRVKLEVANADGGWMAGMRVNADLRGARATAAAGGVGPTGPLPGSATADER